MATKKKIPSPGSDAALKLGCKCPVLDNGHGRGCGWVGEDGTELFWQSDICPIHGHKESEVAKKKVEPERKIDTVYAYMNAEIPENDAWLRIFEDHHGLLKDEAASISDASEECVSDHQDFALYRITVEKIAEILQSTEATVVKV